MGEGARAEVPISAPNQESVTSYAGDTGIAHLAKVESTSILHCKLPVFPFEIVKYLGDSYANILFLLTLPLGSVLKLPGLRCLTVVEGRGHKATDASVRDVGGRRRAEAAASAKVPRSLRPVKTNRGQEGYRETAPRATAYCETVRRLHNLGG